MGGSIPEARVNYEQALAEAAAYFEKRAASAEEDSALRFFCLDAAATCRNQTFPIPAMDPTRRSLD